ncbi:MAG: hypothetical protein ACTSYM_13695 [Candidatus Baldrarchaeia archaeon]
MERRYSHHYEDEFPDRCQNARAIIAETVQNLLKRFPELSEDKIVDLEKLLHDFLRDENNEVVLTRLKILEEASKRKPEIIKHTIRDLVDCLLRNNYIKNKAAELLLSYAESYTDTLKNEINGLFKALIEHSKDWDMAEPLTDMIYTIWKKYPQPVEKSIEKIGNKLDEYGVEAIEWLAGKCPKMILNIVPKLKKLLYSEYLELREPAASALVAVGTDYPHLIEDILPKLTELLIDECLDTSEWISETLTSIIKKHPGQSTK